MAAIAPATAGADVERYRALLLAGADGAACAHQRKGGKDWGAAAPGSDDMGDDAEVWRPGRPTVSLGLRAWPTFPCRCKLEQGFVVQQTC